MSESALDRTARALDLVPYLLEHQGISITELSEVFGVSEKQINDDLILIHMSTNLVSISNFLIKSKVASCFLCHTVS